MKINFIKYVLLVSAGILLFGCKKHTNTPATANVMFVNGFTGVGNVDISVNGIKQVVASNLTFSQNSGYQSVTAGTKIEFLFALASQPQIVNGFGIQIIPDLNYSIFAGGLGTPLETFGLIYSDDLSAPSSGMAKVRFLNLSSDSLNLNCFIGTQKLDSNVSFAAITPFFQIPATTSGDSVLLQDLSRPESAILSGQSFEAGQIYTIMLTGTLNGTLTSQLIITVIDN